MELRVLRYFLTVAREESITKAAEILHLTQPTLSRQLMNLEEELGAQLLVRGKRSVSLTEAGMLLRQRAEEIVAISDKTERDFREQKNFVGGVISIGSVESLTSQVLAKLLKSFNSEYPQVSFNLFSGTGDEIKEKIDKGLIDVGIVIEPINIEKYDFIRLPEKERWGILTKKSSHLADKEFITSKDLVGESIINISRPIAQNEISNWFGDDYECLNILATYNLISNVASLVENDLGNAICIEGALTTRNSDLLCFRPFYPELTSKSVIVWQKHKIFNSAANRFIQFIKDAF